jgi:AraC-like DNA-binding protein
MGRIAAAGITQEVNFELVDGAVNDLVDDAYRAKYKGSPYLCAPHCESDLLATHQLLAELVHMSVSSFHEHFRPVTSMSPLHYQKVLRWIRHRRHIR